mgnify:CR=1 FL=1
MRYSMKGQEDIMANILKFVAIMAIVVFMLLSTLTSHVSFVSDIKSVGRESYNKFTLTEKILNSPGCTKSRGIFYLNSVNEQDEQCHFKGCEVPSHRDWSYSLSSEEADIDLNCEKSEEKFKTAQSLPVVLFDREKKTYFAANIIIYGKHETYTPRVGTESYSKVMEEVVKSDNVQRESIESEIESSSSFKCDYDSDAKCKIIAVSTESDMRTDSSLKNPLQKIDSRIVIRGTSFKEDLEKKKLKSGIERWRMAIPQDFILEGGEKFEIKSIWELRGINAKVDHIYIFVRYQVE